MIDDTPLAVSTRNIQAEEPFVFSCHKGVSCFTECCRMLELALSPYDLLRLRKSTGKSSTELLDQFVIMEQEPAEPFPRFYLTMIDDGRASCVFVSADGCTVYKDRPAACRTYPLGRAVQKQSDGSLKEQFVIVQEEHCRGFFEKTQQSPIEYTADQELHSYNRFNDLMAGIFLHDSIGKGFIPSKKQIELFTLALYDLDRFREMVVDGAINLSSAEEIMAVKLSDDEYLLEQSIAWVKQLLFSPFK
ncbi:YkgJ family cysteine cluster protein [Desulforhopalus sp. IMCC35007]|uniref:YkgJ family cysteine cluster protein n=1 Tax=Desulforhopalus sp. IMCC35007 TaxID=2569543 RepID=UPI0010ADD45A|nr:YkgJ family cysteine cluster protein [Desulforhopalus sp. IMCC35007]TKB12168.1 YkgJ family cysteine cluster protein [Desulforhopalus sp. IMCC35007]